MSPAGARLVGYVVGNLDRACAGAGNLVIARPGSRQRMPCLPGCIMWPGDREARSSWC